MKPARWEGERVVSRWKLGYPGYRISNLGESLGEWCRCTRVVDGLRYDHVGLDRCAEVGGLWNRGDCVRL